MYLIFKKGILRGILSKAIVKAGNIRLLERDIKIPRSTLSAYHMEKRAIKKDKFDKLINYLDISIKEEDILRQLPDNWKQIKGGKKCVEIKKRKGTFEKQLKECHKKSSDYMKLWHKKMKKDNPERYHIMQYEKFKKISGYKFITENREKVRNSFEKEIANLLKKLGLDYEYEPIIKIRNRCFFPDFLINNKIIVECTKWRGRDKAIKLKNKIKFLKKKYKVYVVIPKPLKRYYEILNHHLLLGLDDLKQVLQKSG